MRETQRLSLVIVFCFQLFVSIKLLNIFSDKKIVFSSPPIRPVWWLGYGQYAYWPIVNTLCRFPAVTLVRMRYIPTQQPTEAVYKDQQERVDGEESSGSRVIAASDYPTQNEYLEETVLRAEVRGSAWALSLPSTGWGRLSDYRSSLFFVFSFFVSIKLLNIFSDKKIVFSSFFCFLFSGLLRLLVVSFSHVCWSVDFMAELDVSVLKQSVSFSFCLLQPFACKTRVPGTGTTYYSDFAFF